MNEQNKAPALPVDGPIVGTVTFVMNGSALTMSFNAFSDAVVRSAIERVRAEIKKELAPKTPERLALDLVERAGFMGTGGCSTVDTPPEFSFQETVHPKSRQRAAVIASIILERGPIATRRIFFFCKKFPVLASVKSPQTAYDYAALLTRCGIVEDVGSGCRGARWAIRKGRGISSNSDIAAAISLVDDDAWAAAMNKEHGGK